MTREKVTKDLKKISNKLGSFGPGTAADRNAQLFLQAFDVLIRRIDNIKALQILYVQSESAKEMLPNEMLQVVTQVCNETIAGEEAVKRLIELKSMYMEVIHEMSILPTLPTLLKLKK